MDVLAYLVLPPPATSQAVGPERQLIQIRLGDRRTYEGDEEHLQRFSTILLGLGKDATFDSLHAMLPFRWYESGGYDTVNPFGDDREIQYKALWTFDLKNNVLLHTNHDCRRTISLALLRERIVTMADMESLGPPVPLPLEPVIDSQTSFWKPQVEIDERMSPFTRRLLNDFNHQWRHILRNNYNSRTLRVLARAVIRLSTLAFEVREETKERHNGERGSYVWITDLPAWEPFDADIVRVGNIYIVLCQSLSEGLAMARHHAASHDFTNAENSLAANSIHPQPHYIVLSVKQIVLCRAIGPNALQHTAPEPLFNGNHVIGPPSDLALDYLLWATATANESIATPLRSLPIEVQDSILRHVSVGTVAAAKIGCLLGLGSPFCWKDGHLDIELEETYTNRSPFSPTESQIWFDEHKSGIVYKGR